VLDEKGLMYSQGIDTNGGTDQHCLINK